MFTNAHESDKPADRRSSRSLQLRGSRELPSLTEEQQQFLDDYRIGHLTEETFQARLADDPVLSDYVRMVCNT